MGYTPAQVGAMSWWEFLACRDGYLMAQGSKKTATVTEADIDRLAQAGVVGLTQH